MNFDSVDLGTRIIDKASYNKFIDNSIESPDRSAINIVDKPSDKMLRFDSLLSPNRTPISIGQPSNNNFRFDSVESPNRTSLKLTSTIKNGPITDDHILNDLERMVKTHLPGAL